MDNKNKKAKPPVRMKGKRVLAVVIAAVLVLGAAAGTTLAWLTDKTGPVTNTFTVGDIDIKLTESTGTQYQMVPGATITKNPLVEVVTGSEKCYLFVKLEEDLGGWTDLTLGNNQQKYKFTDLLTYTVVSSWTAIDSAKYPGVYYIVVDTPKDGNFQTGVLVDNKIEVSYKITEEMMNVLHQGSIGQQPTLTVTAYAIQYYKTNGEAFTPAGAWEALTAQVYPPVVY